MSAHDICQHGTMRAFCRCRNARDRVLEDLLKKAAKHVMTPEERFEQRVSWVYGQMQDCNPNVTKEEIRKRLEQSRATR